MLWYLPSLSSIVTVVLSPAVTPNGNEFFIITISNCSSFSDNSSSIIVTSNEAHVAPTGNVTFNGVFIP